MDDQVTLQSQDGQDFKVEVKVAYMSNTIKDLIEDAGVDLPIHLPNVTGEVLRKVVEYCKYHTLNPDLNKKTEEEEHDSTKFTICEWDVEFCKVEQSTLFELIMAANYLDIKDLLDLTCKTVAGMIKGKTPEEIRTMFNIVNDFTPEEEERIRLENQWCEEAE